MGVPCPAGKECEQRGSICNLATGQCDVPPPKPDGTACGQGRACRGGVCTGGHALCFNSGGPRCHKRCIYEPIECTASRPNSVIGVLQHPASHLNLPLPQPSARASPARGAANASSAAASATAPLGGAACRHPNVTARPAARGAPARAACAQVGKWSAAFERIRTATYAAFTNRSSAQPAAQTT